MEFNMFDKVIIWKTEVIITCKGCYNYLYLLAHA